VSLFTLSRIPRALVVGSVGVGLNISRSASGARRIRGNRSVAGRQSVEQVFDSRHSNKFSKQVFEWLFGPVWLAV
jgi:hypothetical protein